MENEQTQKDPIDDLSTEEIHRIHDISVKMLAIDVMISMLEKFKDKNIDPHAALSGLLRLGDSSFSNMVDTFYFCGFEAISKNPELNNIDSLIDIAKEVGARLYLEMGEENLDKIKKSCELEIARAENVKEEK